MAIETYFKNIANAIRTKSGTSGLITPAQMPQAIADIPSGGGVNWLTPLATDINNGFISGDYFYYSNPNEARTDVYQLEVGETYIILLGSTVGNRFRVVQLPTNPVNATADIIGTAVRTAGADNPTPYESCWFIASHIYLAIGKTNQNVDNIPTYVIKAADLTGD